TPSLDSQADSGAYVTSEAEVDRPQNPAGDRPSAGTQPGEELDNEGSELSDSFNLVAPAPAPAPSSSLLRGLDGSSAARAAAARAGPAATVFTPAPAEGGSSPEAAAGVTVSAGGVEVAPMDVRRAGPSATPPPGYSPTQIRHAYGFDRIPAAADGTPGDGRGVTIPIIVPPHAPTIAPAPHLFSTQFDLPTTTIAQLT